jgi:hypothetical protein
MNQLDVDDVKLLICGLKSALCAALSDEGKQLVDDILGGLAQNKKFSPPVQFIFRVAADKPPSRPRFRVIDGGNSAA